MHDFLLSVRQSRRNLSDFLRGMGHRLMPDGTKYDEEKVNHPRYAPHHRGGATMLRPDILPVHKLLEHSPFEPSEQCVLCLRERLSRC